MQDDSAIVVEAQVAVVSGPDVALNHMEQHPLFGDVIVLWRVQEASGLGQQEGDDQSAVARHHNEGICQSVTAWTTPDSLATEREAKQRK